MTGEGVDEREFVEECPTCSTRFLGMSPEEFRAEHAPECNPLLQLMVFTEP